MNGPVQTSEITEFMNRHLAEVFQTMLSLEASPHAQSVPASPRERVSGSLGFGGETVTGAVYIHLSASFAARAAAAMLGLEPEATSTDADVNDVVGEVTNMLGG